MAADLDEVRRLALGWPGVTEGVCFGTPTFYVGRKLMLRMKEDGETLVVRCPLEEREALMEDEPDVFSVTEHYSNYPAILMSLPAVGRARLATMIERAWRMQAPKKAVAAHDQAGR